MPKAAPLPPPITPAALKALVDSFPWETWAAEELGPGFASISRDLVQTVGGRQTKALGGSWNPKDPFTTEFMTQYVGERITQLVGTTKDRVTRIVRDTLAESGGLTSTELGGLLQAAVEDLGDEMARYRGNLIARTEAAIVANHGTVLGIRQAGGEKVDVFDGTDDEVCALANGDTWTIDQALADPIGHPNCVRAFAPHIDDEE